MTDIISMMLKCSFPGRDNWQLSEVTVLMGVGDENEKKGC